MPTKSKTSIDIAKILKEQREEYQRYLGMAVEDFGSQIKVVAETLTGIMATLVKMQGQIATMQEQIASLYEMVAKNTEDIEMIKMEVQLMRRDLKQKADRDEVLLLENRVAKLEKIALHR
jgi:chromosome segregation ATPase